MRSKGFNRVIVAGEFGLREQRVDLLVARTTEKYHRQPFSATEVSTRAIAFVKGSRNKMMPRQTRGNPTAEGTLSILHARPCRISSPFPSLQNRTER